MRKNSRRGSKPGERRGGRKKGTPNKITLNIIKALEDVELDPITLLKKSVSRLTANQKAQVALELAQYVFPKRKAVDAAGDATDEMNLTVKVKWADETDASENTNAHAQDASAHATAKKN